MSKYSFCDSEKYAVYVVHGERCYLCRKPLALSSMEVDHVLPESLIGSQRLEEILINLALPVDFNINNFENWLPSCKECNNKKSALVFDPSPIIQVYLQKLAEKKNKAVSAAKEIIGNQKISLAITTLLRYAKEKAFTPEQRAMIEPLFGFHQANPHRENPKAPVLLSPLLLSPKTTKEKIQAFDDHQTLLRDGFHSLREDPGYLKLIAAELNTLVCDSSGADGLLWRLINELDVSDEIYLEAAVSIKKDHPINNGLIFAKIPLDRPGNSPPGIQPEHHSLEGIIKDYEAVHLSSFQGHVITHEYLINAIAQQMGSANEADGLEPNIRRLQRIVFNGIPSFVPILAFDAELVLQVGERLLDHCEETLNYRRAERTKGCGDLTLILRCNRLSDFIGIVPALSFSSEISEVEIRYVARSASLAFQFYKRGQLVREESVPFTGNSGLHLFAISYSSSLRQIRIIVNGIGQKPVDCDLGWLDARELAHPLIHPEINGLINIDWVFSFIRLLSPAECEAIRSIPTESVVDSMQEDVTDDGFPN